MMRLCIIPTTRTIYLQKSKRTVINTSLNNTSSTIKINNNNRKGNKVSHSTKQLGQHNSLSSCCWIHSLVQKQKQQYPFEQYDTVNNINKNRIINRQQRKQQLEVVKNIQKRFMYFATPEYEKCFYNLPKPDTDALRTNALLYIDKIFQQQLWYTEPIVSLLKGNELKSNTSNDSIVHTINGLGEINGKQIYSTQDEIQQIIYHLQNYQSPYVDLRTIIRTVENQLLGIYSADLIGNQCIDFQKQDGVTELEECIMVSRIEQRLNDLLYQAEQGGDGTTTTTTTTTTKSVIINRQPIYINTVSNFSNFLDLFRKTIRSLELGIPVIILGGRTNTIQHTYRWTKLLQQLINEQDPTIIESGMITYISAPINDIKTILTTCQQQTGTIYATCSRNSAQELKSLYPNTIASTGGPNTLVVVEDLTGKSTTAKNNNTTTTAINTLLPDNLVDAIRTSATIESSGQCTALRHVVVPTSISNDQLEKLFDSGIIQIPSSQSAIDALRSKTFTGIFAKNNNNNNTNNTTTIPSSLDYKKSTTVDAYYRINTNTLPPIDTIPEYWRTVVIDYSKLNIMTDPADLQLLAVWLRQCQPISISINGIRKDSFTYGIKLWERTSAVVCTIGSTDHSEMLPALTCQARPQDGEIFGEIPPQSTMTQYTKFPVLIPSSNPSYDTRYDTTYLSNRRIEVDIETLYIPDTKKLLSYITDPIIYGYCIEVIEYLRSVCKLNPKLGVGTNRTVVYGIQSPPLGTVSVLRCGPNTTYNDIAPIQLLFWSTRIRNQLIVSIDPSNTVLPSIFDTCTVPYIIEDTVDATTKYNNNDTVFHYIVATEQLQNDLIQQYPLADKFVSLFFPMGHIKCTRSVYDEEFEFRARLSKKWLDTVF